MRALWLILLVSVLVTGCATSGPAWISASKFDYEAYEDQPVVLFPVIVSPQVSETRLEPPTIEKAIQQQLHMLSINKIVKPDGVSQPAFPYTPKRLADLAMPLGARGAVGASITRVEKRPRSNTWSITGNIVFVDVEKADRYWTLSKTWAFVGEPGDSGMYNQLRSELLLDFFDVRRALQRSYTNRFLRRDTILTEPGPIVSLDAADWELTRDARTARGEVRIGDTSAYTGGSPGLQVDYSVIDDDGIEELIIENVSTGFRLSVTETLRTVPDASGTGDLPIFLANRVLVPLAPGVNEIRLRAMNTKKEIATRNLIFTSTQTAAKPSRELMVIAANQFRSFPETPVLQKAQKEIKALDALQAVNLPGGGRVLTFSGKTATREQVLSAAANQWDQPGPSTRRELAVLGRAEIIDDEPVIFMYDSDSRFPEVGSLSLNELKRILGMGVSTAVLDLCTSQSSPEEIRRSLSQSLDARVRLTVGQDCVKPLGDLFLTLETDDLADSLEDVRDELD
jgi:hypothetical protein